MITREELLKMREQSFEEVNIKEIPDIKDVAIDKKKSKKERIQERLDVTTHFI